MATKLYVNQGGFKVQVIGSETDEVIEFAPQGGGFAKCLPRPQFFAEFKAYAVPDFTPRQATFEFFEEGASIAAWSNGLYWNGWAMPYFTREQGIEVMKFFSEVHFDAERDAFVWDDSGEEEVYAAVTIETESGPITAYPIGTGSWTWEWADEDC